MSPKPIASRAVCSNRVKSWKTGATCARTSAGAHVREVDAVPEDAPRCRRQQTADQFGQRALAGPVRADHRQHLPGLQSQAHAVEHRGVARRVGVAHRVEHDLRWVDRHRRRRRGDRAGSRKERPERFEVTEVGHALDERFHRRAAAAEPAGELLECDDRDGRIGDADLLIEGEQHHDRQRHHEDDRRDRRADEGEHGALLDDAAGVQHPLGEQRVVAGAEPAGEAERPHLAGFQPVGEEPFVVRAVAVEFGEVVVHPVQRPGVADVDDGDRDERHERDGHQHGRHAEEHQDDDGTGERRRHERDEAPHDLPGVGVGVFAGEPDPVVEGGVFERLEFDGGGDFEQLVHRPTVHEFAQQDAQFGHRGVDE